MVARFILISIILLSSMLNGFSQTPLRTRAEKSDFKSTSDYEDVMDFIRQLKSTTSYLRVETIAKTTEGRDIPLLVIGNPLPDSPEDLANDHGI